MNGPRHVIIAMSITAILFLIAGDSWNERIGRYKPVQAAAKK